MTRVKLGPVFPVIATSITPFYFYFILLFFFFPFFYIFSSSISLSLRFVNDLHALRFPILYPFFSSDFLFIRLKKKKKDLVRLFFRFIYLNEKSSVLYEISFSKNFFVLRDK